MSEPAFEIMVRGIKFRYWNCAVKFIPVSVLQWLQLYTYHKNFMSAAMPKYKDTSSRFIRFSDIYESKLSHYQNLQMEINRNGR